MRSIWALAALLSLAAAASDSPPAQKPLGAEDVPSSAHPKPNVVFILTDDQDLHMDSLDYMPLLKKHLVDHGTKYNHHYSTTAICCPARVTIWTGKAAHNTNVTDLKAPYGGFPKFVREGLNENYLPVWLQEAGYNTYYLGKLFNAHTIYNYDRPHVKGWTGSEFLLDPYTYLYLNATFQRNHDAPVSHEGEYVTDVLAAKTQGFLDDALAARQKDDTPFFIAVATSAPHSNVDVTRFTDPHDVDKPRDWTVRFTTPIPAERHAHLFPDAVVPRGANFNPEVPSGANWIRGIPRLSEEDLTWNDDFYRNRLRALQAVDELIDGVVAKVAAAGQLDNTYFVFTSDNGFHISQHRLQPGKECGFEEDINVPLIIRGPGVPEGAVSDAVTAHADLAPTVLSMVGAPPRPDFDGVPIPLTGEQQAASRHEHVTVEYWGMALSEGRRGYGGGGWDDDFGVPNNTYKAVRVLGGDYSLYYSVWCTNEHELYDMVTDPGQMRNVLGEGEATPRELLGRPLDAVVARLDALLLVTKTCKGSVCADPWKALHPQGDVKTLRDALAPRFDKFYVEKQPRVSFGWCVMAQLLEAEGALFEQDGVAFWDPYWSDLV